MNRIELHLVTAALVKNFARHMKRITNIFLVLFFALLQCASPLAHAHVGGDHSGQRVHINEVQQQLEHTAKLLSSSVTVGAPASPVISMPQSKPRNNVQLAFSHPMIYGYFTPLPVQATVGVKFQSASKQPSPPFLFFPKQYPQAPPAL